MIDEIKSDVQTAIAELRALAHGIFPPLLVSGGLCDALPAAAARSALPTTLELDNVGRYGNDIEAAVYFCTLEALQNAGKHAGDGATATVRVSESDGVLRFEISDDGAGFEMSGDASQHGHGFVNMADRLGAFGGTVDGRLRSRRTAPRSRARSPCPPRRSRQAVSSQVGSPPASHSRRIIRGESSSLLT